MFKTTFRGIFYLQKFNYTKEKSKQAGLMSTALFIAGACKRTIRISPNPSSPGSPVHSRTRGGLRMIETAVYRNGALIGPVKFPSSNFFNEPVPHIHEFGGTFFSRFGLWTYPERSYMYRTLKQLHASNKINKRFSATMATRFN